MDFDHLDIPIPKYIYMLSEDVQKNVYEYLTSMDYFQKNAYLIAYNHLGTSFNILLSNGYMLWIKDKK